MASLSDYNAGLLLGEWIDLDGKDADDVQGEIAAMLRTSKHPNVSVACPICEGTKEHHHPLTDLHNYASVVPCLYCKGTGKVPSAEEWSIHDYDDCPDMGENPSLEDLCEQVRLVEEHGDAWRAYIEWRHVNDVSESDFEDCRAGEADSEEDWIDNFLEETGVLDEMPENLRSYFDSSRYLRDMELNGDVSFEYVNGTTYAFWNH
ncbi:antirestriction protein [Rhodanobacter sp. ANJX3]|uniref:antirestriction protein ArdA n=1 Tax=Rhodanobacter sp. ANJX3 TaxID=2723083 RepID=UPI00161CC093|nr:antirestriction protein [Rhodanobacter sp. ANJX3]